MLGLETGPMREHLQSHLKPLMAAHPDLGPVLEAAGIGCTQCSLGTCRVQDILELHNLDTAQSRALLTAMGRVIYQDQSFEVPEVVRTPAPAKSSLCPPVARMVQEHTFILRVVKALPALARFLAADFEGTRPWVMEALAFIRTYADAYHHAKEEDLLFACQPEDSEVLGVFRQDHVDGRAHVAAAHQGLEHRDAAAVQAALQAYGALLTGHIHREDTILFPWLDRSLSDHQVGRLFQACAEVERQAGDMPARMEAFVPRLEVFLASR